MQPPLKILVRLTPKARRTAFLGWSEDAEGRRVLKASVTAAPEKGKANAALIALLAGHWRHPEKRHPHRTGRNQPQQNAYFKPNT
jgi:uncharacterized protein YggU (UPF0235/DUF167 family)